MSKIDPKKLSYEGCDLEAMIAATKYYSWLLKTIRPYIGSNVVEVGAGSGSFSRQLLSINPDQLTVVEPAKNMFKMLQETVKENKSKKTKVIAHNAFMNEVIDKVAKTKPDTFIYINVFEHIEDDLKELKMIKKNIQKGGHVIIFVPALQSLFSDFDESIGHFRRYSRRTVTELAENAGLEVVKTMYMDMVGVVPWWVSFKLLKREKLTMSMVGAYDSYCVPVIRTVESVVPAPFGKNVLLVAKKQ
jgi:16S rRNA G966 N2-methylase RsmD